MSKFIIWKHSFKHKAYEHWYDFIQIRNSVFTNYDEHTVPTCFLSFSAGGAKLQSHRTSWWLCNCIETKQQSPHFTLPKSMMSVETCMSGIVTAALSRRLTCGPPTTYWKQMKSFQTIIMVKNYLEHFCHFLKLHSSSWSCQTNCFKIKTVLE